LAITASNAGAITRQTLRIEYRITSAFTSVIQRIKSNKCLCYLTPVPKRVRNNILFGKLYTFWPCSPVVQERLLFGGGHMLKDDLKIIHFGDPYAKILRQTTADTRFANS